ncbi:MAG: inorganic phosphate transporter [Chromatiales bacterium]|jgi:PiT family inorganic phosphate transporter
MDVAILIFLSSGLFLGWSLGANDAANVFGTAVGTRMVRFTTAALVCAVFVALGAVFSGAGAAHTLGALGTVNALPGAFMAALAAALTVYGMTRAGLPVSTSQAIVGAIIGWNLFSGFPTDLGSLGRIVATWVACPVLAALVAIVLYRATAAVLRRSRTHLLRLDAYTRTGLILAGAFGAYSLGANNIANVMGVFLESNPFSTFSVAGLFSFTGVQQLFLLGALAVGVGVYSYSRRVMMTVGADIMPLSPVGAWIVVVAHSIVLFLFASEGLEHLLATQGLPTIPLVPVSSSQAVVGAVLGIGLVKGGAAIQWRPLLSIASGWVTTPVIACALCFVSLFFLQNVFQQEVYRDQAYRLSPAVLERLRSQGVDTADLRDLEGERVQGVRAFRRLLAQRAGLGRTAERRVLSVARIAPIELDPARIAELDGRWLSAGQRRAVEALSGRRFEHRWALAEALAQQSDAWRQLPETTANKLHNREIRRRLDHLYRRLGSGD